jgi:hypothetical protein
MFRRFIDLSLSESVPDHSTIWRFRNSLQKQGLYEVLLAEIYRVSTDWISYNHLKARHLIAGCKAEIIELLASDQE